jgi:hypothetical protein
MTFAAEILIALVPALLLFAALLAGRYPGERTIARFVSRTQARRPRRAPRTVGSSRRAPRISIRPGEFLARSLATRPPPSPLTT